MGGAGVNGGLTCRVFASTSHRLSTELRDPQLQGAVLELNRYLWRRALVRERQPWTSPLDCSVKINNTLLCVAFPSYFQFSRPWQTLAATVSKPLVATLVFAKEPMAPRLPLMHVRSGGVRCTLPDAGQLDSICSPFPSLSTKRTD